MLPSVRLRPAARHWKVRPGSIPHLHQCGGYGRCTTCRVQIPQGGEPVKYELDKESGAVFVDRFLHTAMFYPGNYGFVPHTLAEDGDPIDVLIVGPVSVVPGAVVRCRPIGGVLMEDEAGPDEKIIAVPVD